MTYNFKCHECNHKFEQFNMRVQERDLILVFCPKCGSNKTQRIITKPTNVKVPPWHIKDE